MQKAAAAVALKIFGKVDTSKLFLSLLMFLFLLLSGDMCCAQFTTDNQWYRARIKTAYSPAHPNTVPTLENNLCVEVQYIDYGNSEWLPLSRLVWKANAVGASFFFDGISSVLITGKQTYEK